VHSTLYATPHEAVCSAQERSLGAHHRSLNWIYAALELAALASIVVASIIVWAIETHWTSTPIDELAAAARGLGSGLGWLLARRPVTSAVVALLRVGATAPYAYLAARSLECESRCSDPPGFVVVPLLIAFVVAYVGIPIASAVLLWLETTNNVRRAA
jgi:hypothetical protein